MTTAEDVERAVRAPLELSVLDRYKRRGTMCAFTWRISGFAPLKDGDGEAYDETFWWAWCRWTGDAWVCIAGHGHELYPAPRDPTQTELLAALNESNAAKRAVAAIGDVS